MTKNEIVARFYGCKHQHNPTHFGGRGMYWSPTSSDGKTRTFFAYEDELYFDSDYNWLHEAWVKFRDLKFSDIPIKLRHSTYANEISMAIAFGTITEAFDELVKGIEWYESLKK